jgi:hypothetical protein
MPEGVSYEGVFGEQKEMAMQAAPAAMAGRVYRAGGFAGGAQLGATAEARPVAPSTANRRMAYIVRDEEAPAVLSKQKAQLHPDVADLVRGSRTNTSLVKNGKAELKLYLTSKEPAILQSLKALGFEVVEQDPLAMTVTGRIAVDKIAELAKLDGIRYIAPR